MSGDAVNREGVGVRDCVWVLGRFNSECEWNGLPCGGRVGWAEAFACVSTREVRLGGRRVGEREEDSDNTASRGETTLSEVECLSRSAESKNHRQEECDGG